MALSGTDVALLAEARDVINYSDVDGTLIPRRHSRDTARTSREARAALDASGVTIANTARHPAQLLSRGQRMASDLAWPEPHCMFDEHGEPLPKFAGALDFPAALCFGSGDLYRRAGRYYLDQHYLEIQGREWRDQMLALNQLIQAGDEISRHYAAIERKENYDNGTADVPPLPYRLQLHFSGSTAVEDMLRVQHLILEHEEALRKFGPTLDPSETNRFKAVLGNLQFHNEGMNLYLSPVRASKEDMAERLYQNILDATGKRHFKRRYFGDMPPDLEAGSACDEFVIVGESPMAPYICGNRTGESFAAQSFAPLVRQLTETKRPGWFINTHPDGRQTLLIVGDVAFPGTKGPETIIAFCEDELKQTMV